MIQADNKCTAARRENYKGEIYWGGMGRAEACKYFKGGAAGGGGRPGASILRKFWGGGRRAGTCFRAEAGRGGGGAGRGRPGPAAKYLDAGGGAARLTKSKIFRCRRRGGAADKMLAKAGWGGDVLTGAERGGAGGGRGRAAPPKRHIFPNSILRIM